MTTCAHPESRTWGSDPTRGVFLRFIPGHDCEYVAFRNSKIAAAEAMALAAVPRPDRRYTRLFMAAMDELCNSIPFPKGIL